MQTKNNSLKLILGGVLISAALTAVIGFTAASLTRFEIIGHTVPFAYPWRLVERSDLWYILRETVIPQLSLRDM